jgi:hypothetical protein
MKILKIHTLEKGWCDKDYVMLHAAFQILVDFIEQEKPDQIVDWNSDPEHKRAWREIRLLYRRWAQGRPARRSPLDEKGFHDSNCKVIHIDNFNQNMYCMSVQ